MLKDKPTIFLEIRSLLPLCLLGFRSVEPQMTLSFLSGGEGESRWNIGSIEDGMWEHLIANETANQV
jgi:hypothetical protein